MFVSIYPKITLPAAEKKKKWKKENHYKMNTIAAEGFAFQHIHEKGVKFFLTLIYKSNRGCWNFQKFNIQDIT